ncbi:MULTISPECIES: amino acid adenylation domain-containing protein [Legionella]|uniref:Peptide synthetase, non-ribosomal n=1 Tax=Legionella maceachernii TaxID=466 RepID=A0A0W0W1B4_9GAMM|nr:amino acid adenylation domain-containing protein [Legionella maceachernii]KTD26041.1 peptide synthetase, non-ribosomal [Legionella maceachernii]SJZ51500.1 amino acid adenylation domain-containing protein [Legionella maceachernii]SUP03678.1 Chondramide synthase cmdD [Legionella maceachernii]
MFKNFIELFESQVNLYPDKLAIIFKEEQITYKELAERSNCMALSIRNEINQSQSIIPLILERNPDIIISILAVFKMGCAFLPISPITPCSRIKFILKDTDAGLIVSNLDLDPSIVSNITVVNPSKIGFVSGSVNKPFLASDLAYVMYTSGTTGNPKGVLVEHRSMMNLFSSLISELPVEENEKFLALTDYTFDISLIELLMPLLKGGTILLTEHGSVADGFKIRQYLKKNHITCMQATPLTWEILLKQGWKNDGQMKILVGGEKFSTRLAESLMYEKGNVWNMYGPTETSMWSMYNHIKERLFTDSVPLGKPLHNTVIKILDSNLNEVNIGAQGELYIGGIGLARGYLNNPDLTAEKFIYHPATKMRLYKTGDLVIAQDQNTVCYMGRVDDQLKFGGIRIEAGEIESVIEQEPFVKKAVVKLHETEGYYKSLAAYVEIDEKSIFNEGFQKANLEVSCFLKNIYDETYLHAEEHEHGLINNCGWQSSFTGELFSIEELSESYQWIRKFIRGANLSHILEVGCGTGSLLLEYIDDADDYTVVEISSKAIDYVKSRLNQEQSKKITFKNESVLNLTDKQQYSCIIINSVIQYLPSVDALMVSLTKLIGAAQTNGTIIIGDVRSLELMDVFILEKIRVKSQDSEDLYSHLSSFYYKARDTEIVISPKFFYALKNIFEEISHVDIAVKHGDYKNELNYFRYDVILHINKEINYQTPNLVSYNLSFTVEKLRELTSSSLANPIIIKNIPNIHMQEFIVSINKDIPDYLPFPYQLSSYSENEISQINSLIKLDFPTHDKFIVYDPKDPLNTLGIHLYPKKKGSLIRHRDKSIFKKYSHYCREPFNPWLQHYCFERIKSRVNKNVVSWVHPSAYVWIEKWPFSINGKLDKKKLNLPLKANVDNQGNLSTLEQLKIIWQNITGDDAIVEKEFWVHGVSSLCMYFFLATINETFPVNINYHEFRDYNTLIKLANYIDQIVKSSPKIEFLNQRMEATHQWIER